MTAPVKEIAKTGFMQKVDGVRRPDERVTPREWGDLSGGKKGVKGEMVATVKKTKKKIMKWQVRDIIQGKKEPPPSKLKEGEKKKSQKPKNRGKSSRGRASSGGTIQPSA